MADVADRRAAMVSTVVLAIPGQEEEVGQGRVSGRLAHDQRGSGGFGYDAVFILDDGRRLSEVVGEEKDRVGHRGQAVRAVVPALVRWLAALGRT
jgi:XTP/dITP diphosphohydrolase